MNQSSRRWCRFAAIHLAIFLPVQAAFIGLFRLRFDSAVLDYYMHFLDPQLLRTRLIESCFYLHIQPPLFNFLVGLGLKVFGDHSTQGFHAVYLLLAFGLYVALTSLQIRLGVGRYLALAMSTGFMVSPPFLLYEHWLFYTLPCAFLLVASGILLHEALQKGYGPAILSFFTALMLLSYLRSLFHLLFVGLIYLGLCLVAKPYRKRFALWGLVPILLVVALYAKNYALFGSFSTSTIMGRNLWVMTVGNMNSNLRYRLIEQGKLSDISGRARWNALKYYPNRYQGLETYPNVAALHTETKSNGAHNFNHIDHIAISNQYLKDALDGILLDPKTFLKSLTVSTYAYFRAVYACSYQNYQRLFPWVRCYERGPCLVVPLTSEGNTFLHRLTGTTDVQPALTLILGLPLLAFYLLWCTLRGTTAAGPVDGSNRIVMAYMAFAIAYVAAIGCAFDFWETARYRFITDGFSVTAAGLFIQQTLQPRLRNLRRWWKGLRRVNSTD